MFVYGYDLSFSFNIDIASKVKVSTETASTDSIYQSGDVWEANLVNGFSFALEGSQINSSMIYGVEYFARTPVEDSISRTSLLSAYCAYPVFNFDNKIKFLAKFGYSIPTWDLEGDIVDWNGIGGLMYGISSVFNDVIVQGNHLSIGVTFYKCSMEAVFEGLNLNSDLDYSRFTVGYIF